MLKAMFMTLLIIIALVIGWHFFFPILGAVIAFSLGAWIILLCSVIAFCIAMMLVFIFTSSGIFLVGLLAFAWTIMAAILFPVVFPIIAPLFIMFLFMAYFVRRRKKNISNKQLT